MPGCSEAPSESQAVLILAAVVGVLWRWGGREPHRRRGANDAGRRSAFSGTAQRPHWQWNWPTLGLALGAVLGWVLAAVAGVDFGPSTVGASAGVAAGDPNWWLIAFLLGIILGVRAMTRSGRRDPATTLPLNDR